MGMQTAFFGYCFDNGFNSVEKELKDRSLKIIELTEKLKAAESSTQTIASLEQSLLDAKTKLTAAENENKVVEVKYSDLGAKYSTAIAEHLEEDKTKLEVDLEALQKEIAIQHTRGFHKAIDQVMLYGSRVDAF
ncbi:hypothetical protein SESBI_37395 [Sesbania bispinosa]|nr:hypothetical protein SESBI_37395 [Sesbania bispinosa]